MSARRTVKSFAMMAVSASSSVRSMPTACSSSTRGPLPSIRWLSSTVMVAPSAAARPGLIAADDHAGPFLDHLDQRGEVVVATAFGHAHVPHLDHVGAEPHRHLEVLRLLEAERDVLVHGRDL